MPYSTTPFHITEDLMRKSHELVKDIRQKQAEQQPVTQNEIEFADAFMVYAKHLLNESKAIPDILNLNELGKRKEKLAIAEATKTIEINPSLAYQDELNRLANNLPDTQQAYDDLAQKCLDECIHTNSDGTLAWTKLTQDVIYCPYCTFRVEDRQSPFL